MKNMNETEEPRCALCVRNGKCAKIFDLIYEGKTAEEIFLYCTALKIRSNEFAICDRCMSDLIKCYEFVKKCRKLPSNYVETYLDIQNKVRFEERPIKQEMAQDETVEENLQECGENYYSKIKVEIDEEMQETCCALCVRNGNCANIFNLNYQDKTAEEIFLYCNALKINNKFAICDGCKSDLIKCYEFVKKCRKLPSNYVEIYLDIEHKLRFEECTIKQEVTHDETVEENLQECDESYNCKIKVEIGEEIDVKFNEDTSYNNDLSCVEDSDVPNQENHCYREDDYEIDEKIKLEKTEIIKFDSGAESRYTTDDGSKINDMEWNGFLIERLDENIENGKVDCDNICVKKYPDNLLKHRVTRKRNNHYNCETCGEFFNNKKRLIDHINTEHTFGECTEEKKIFECDQCGKKFTNKTVLRDHVRIHMDCEPYSCTRCGKSFVLKRALSDHIRQVHLDVGRKKCPKCEKTMSSKYIQAHLRKMHSDKGPCVCDICKKKLSNKNSLEMHMRIHNGNTPYMCETCGKYFGNKDSMVRHINLIHLKMEVCQCPECGKSFQSKKNMKKHIRMIHSNERPHVCDICGKAYALRHVLNEHLLNHIKI